MAGIRVCSPLDVSLLISKNNLRSRLRACTAQLPRSAVNPEVAQDPVAPRIEK